MVIFHLRHQGKEYQGLLHHPQELPSNGPQRQHVAREISQSTSITCSGMEQELVCLRDSIGVRHKADEFDQIC